MTGRRTDTDDMGQEAMLEGCPDTRLARDVPLARRRAAAAWLPARERPDASIGPVPF